MVRGLFTFTFTEEILGETARFSYQRQSEKQRTPLLPYIPVILPHPGPQDIFCTSNNSDIVWRVSVHLKAGEKSLLFSLPLHTIPSSAGVISLVHLHTIVPVNSSPAAHKAAAPPK